MKYIAIAVCAGVVGAVGAIIAFAFGISNNQ